MKRAFIYCRQSSGDDDKSESCEVQEQNCMELAKKNNIQVLGTYEDMNTSGKTYPVGYKSGTAADDTVFQDWLKTTTVKNKYRKGLGDLFAEVEFKGNKVDFILVDDLTRLGRPLNNSQLGNVINQFFIGNQVKVFSVKEGEVDFNNFSNALVSTINGMINDHQIKNFIQKSKDGLKKLKNEGKHQQGLSLAFGFKPTGLKYGIAIDEEQAEIVKTIYKEYLKGTGINTISRLLNQKYNLIFYPRQITNILKHPYYSGFVYNSDGQLIKSQQLENLAFIDFKDWDQAQKSLNKRKTNKRAIRKYWTPLSGYIFCGKCGGRLDRVCSHLYPERKWKENSHYSCKQNLVNRNGLGKPCSVNIVDTVDNKAGLGLIESITPLFLLTAVEQLKKHDNEDNIIKEIEKIEVEIKNLSTQRDKLIKLSMKGLIPDDELENNLMEIKNQNNKLKSDLIVLQNSINSTNDVKELFKNIKRILDNNIDHGEYEKYLMETIKKMSVFSDKVNFNTYFGDITIPRKKIGYYNEMPKFIVKMDGNFKYKKFWVYYYHHQDKVDDLLKGDRELQPDEIIFESENLIVSYID